MSLLFNVLYAVHAKGTHHKLALDGLARLDGPDAERWRRLLLKHAEPMMLGAKAPDDTFKDFKNHVLHPRDNFWGGAPMKAREWYGTLTTALRGEDWAGAAYAAGVLSHYVTDPIQPFHTGQSEAENNIHRALEWSTAKSYEDLKRIARADAVPAVDIPDADNWLEQLLCRSALGSNKHYEKLIAHYDIHRGVVDPPSGLDVIAQRILGELIGVASATYAAVLGRALAESKATPPEVSLSVDAVLATLQIPIKVLAKRMADAKERAVVERMYDELKATGTVEKNLPEDDRAVRGLYVSEVLSQCPPADIAALFPHLPATINNAPHSAANAAPLAAEKMIVPAATPVTAIAPSTQPPLRSEPVAASTPQTKTDAPLSLSRFKPATSALRKLAGDDRPSSGLVARLQSAEAEPADEAEEAASASLPRSGSAAPRLYLTRESPIVDAPSIGPVTAERLAPHDIKTVGDLLAADADALASKLALRHVTADTIRDWQSQANLVCTVPGLRGTHAQLLVGAGYRTPDQLSDAAPDTLCASLLTFAATHDGQRLLRNGDPPDVTRIKSWIDSAKTVRAAA